jgi:MFS family permease
MTGLSRNRDYRLLWTGQALSLFGFNTATIAFPLLTLAVTGSAAASGLVLGAVAAAELVAGLPAGALVDRWNRRAVMLSCEAVQGLAAASVVLAALLHAVTLVHLLVVAAVVGVCGALFEPAEDASLPALVPDDQLGTAVAMKLGPRVHRPARRGGRG